MAELPLDGGVKTEVGTEPIEVGDFEGAPAILMIGNHVIFPNVGAGAVVYDEGPAATSLGYMRGTVVMGAESGQAVHCGICVLMSDDNLTPGAGAQGYGFCIDHVDDHYMLRLVQFTDGLDRSPHPNDHSASTYNVLSEIVNAPFSPGFGVTLRLEWYSDPIQLKGVFLRAVVEDTDYTFAEIVYTGAASYKPTDSGTINGVFMGYFPGDTVAYFKDLSVGLA